MTVGPSVTRRGTLAGLSGLAAGSGVAEPVWAAATAGAGDAEAARPRLFDPRDFGAAGDGAGDDTAAFRAMHRAMRRAQARDDALRAADPARPPQEIVIRLSPGHYRYTWNRWTWGLRRVCVLGYGATIQCLHSGPYDIDQAPLISNREHYWTWSPEGPAFAQPSPLLPAEDFGHRIRTARPGDDAVTLLGPDDARRLLLLPGAWVLIQSYAQQQYGYPPNMRYFERVRIAGAEGARVRFDRRLRYLHRDDWPEDPARPAAIGRARIVAIDRPDCPFALFQSFAGLTVLSNPNHAVRDAVARRPREVLSIAGTLRAHVRDCALIALGVTQVGEVCVEGSTFEYTEPDKLVDRLTFRDCTIGAIRECTGVNQLIVQGCTVEDVAQMLAREVTVEACTFPEQVKPREGTRAISLEGPTPTRRLTIRDCCFLGTGNGAHPPIDGPVWTRIAIDGHALRPLGDGRIGASSGPAFDALAAVLEDGWPVTLFGADGRPHFGWCSGIRGLGAGAVFAFTLPVAPRTGDTLAVPRLLSLSVQGCRFAHPFVAYPDPPDLTWEEEVTGSRLLRLAMRSDAASRPAWLPGLPRRLRCLVAQPYAGPEESCFLILREEPPDPGGLELLIDLRVPGEREVSRSGCRLSKRDIFRVGGVAAERLPDACYVGGAQALIVARPGAVPAPAVGAEAEQADVLIEIEVDNPFGWALAQAGRR